MPVWTHFCDGAAGYCLFFCFEQEKRLKEKAARKEASKQRKEVKYNFVNTKYNVNIFAFNIFPSSLQTDRQPILRLIQHLYARVFFKSKVSKIWRQTFSWGILSQRIRFRVSGLSLVQTAHHSALAAVMCLSSLGDCAPRIHMEMQLPGFSHLSSDQCGGLSENAGPFITSLTMNLSTLSPFTHFFDLTALLVVDLSVVTRGPD